MHHSMTFGDVMEEVKSGNALAFEELHNQVRPLLIGFLWQKKIPGNDLEDIVQETLFRLWKNRADFDRTKGGFMPWVIRIAMNQWKDLCRRRGRQSRGGGATFVDFDIDRIQDDDDQRDVPAIYAALMKEIKRLPKECRKVCRSAIAGMSMRETAKEFGVSATTTCRHLNAACELLQTSVTLQEFS